MSQIAAAPSQILRLRDVKSQTGFSRSTVYLRIHQRLFTRPVRLGGRSVGWPASEVATINAAYIAGLSASQIQGLVEKLESMRSDACGLQAGI